MNQCLLEFKTERFTFATLAFNTDSANKSKDTDRNKRGTRRQAHLDISEERDCLGDKRILGTRCNNRNGQRK